MRRKIALVLALVMILSLIPMSSFAASENRVTRVLQLQKDDLTDGETALVVRNNKGDFEEFEAFSLTLENAEWVGASDLPAYVYNQNSTAIAWITRIDKTRIDVEVEDADNIGNATGDELRIPIFAKVKGGDARITVDPVDSALTGGTYTFATTIEGDTVTTVASTITFGPEETGRTLGNIVIDETVAGVLSQGDELKLTLPRDFEWVSGTGAASFSRGFLNTSAANFAVSDNKRDLTITLTTLNTTTPETRGTIVISGLGIYSEDGRFGDVMMTTGGELTRQSLKVAEFADYAMVVEADGDIEEVVAGRWNDDAYDGFEIATLVFEEKIADSIVAGRRVSVEFPDWVKITSVEETNETDGWVPPTFEPGDSKFEFTPADLTDGKVEFEFEIEVIVEAGAEGDIVAEVSGRGLDRDYEVVLGKAIAPVSVEMAMTEVVIGESSQMLADITITENVEGALMENGWLEILFDIEWLQLQSGVVVEADEDSGLEIDEVKRDGNTLMIEIDRESDEEPGVIEISNIRVSLNRIPATGDYDVVLGGTALVNNAANEEDNDDDEDFDWFEEFDAWSAPMLRVVTERSAAEVEVAFTVGMELEPGVAPYISNDRLMVPVRFLEDVFGTQPIWNATSRTVTVLYNGMVYEMAIGSNVLRVNGAPYMELDANVEITNDRTFVPASRFARAMGIEYSWDPATQTATFSR